MKILMVSSEVTPLAKSGGLADAVQALSATLSLAGHDVRIVMPRYYSIDKSSLEAISGPLGVPRGESEEWATVYMTKLPGSTVPVYLLDHEKYFGRDGIYGTPLEPDFSDNPERFSFLSRAAFQLCRKLKWIPDILHSHDWPSALVPVYLKWLEAEGEFAGTATVLTIHNLGYQGIYPKSSFEKFGLSWECWHGAGFDDFGSVNMLKAGLSEADWLSTVSPSYAREIQTGAEGFRMDGLLRHRSHQLVGILNGIDLDEWNPETDTHLPKQFSVKKMDGKNACKLALQKEFGLEETLEKPLIGMVSRLADQKGIGELFGPTYGSAYSICADMDVQFVLLGSGDRWCEDEIKSLASRLPNFKARIGFNNRLAHLIEAGSDFFMMPSRYEPCGLNQLYSLRYGTLPIAHCTGGIADTVENYNQDKGTGTGFLYDQQSPRAIYDTTGWAVWAFYNRKEHILSMRKRGMGTDFSWNKSAMEYERLYTGALARLGRKP